MKNFWNVICLIMEIEIILFSMARIIIGVGESEDYMHLGFFVVLAILDIIRRINIGKTKSPQE